jgi:hypothetical protein
MDAVSSLFRPSKIIFGSLHISASSPFAWFPRKKSISLAATAKFRPSESVARKQLTPTIFPSNERSGPPEFLGKGRDARRHLAAAKLAALGLAAEPKLDRGRGGGGDHDRNSGDERVPQRGRSEDDEERREHQRDDAEHRLDLRAQETAPAAAIV